MAWAMVIGGGLAAAGTVYSANKSSQANQDMLNAQKANTLDPATVGANSLNAQGQLAGQALNLNNQWGGQFANSNNNALLQSLFGMNNMPGATDALKQDKNFQTLPPDIQTYLSDQATKNGLGSVTGGMQGKSQYENLLSIYQGMGGQLGTPEQADAFNKWTEDKGFGGWGNTDTGGNPLAATLGKWDSTTQYQNPGYADIITSLNKQLNPNYQTSLDALGKAAGQAPTTINPQQIAGGSASYGNVNQSPFANSISQFMANGTAPQIVGPSGQNQGMQHLSNLLGSSGYQQVQGSQAQGAFGANYAGPAATAAIPQMTSAQQAQTNTSGAPVTINAPGTFERIQANSVQGPQGFERVNTPGAVGSVSGPGGVANVQAPTDNVQVNAQTGFERVNAPNAGLQQVSAGQNQLLQNLQDQGFQANRPIQQTLEQQAQGDLALGGQLSADQTRMAQQAARAAAESRGMVGSNGAIVNEVQRQLDMSRQLQNERRTFASGVEQQGFGQLATQQGQAIQAAGVTNDYLGLGVNAQQANNQNALAQAGMGLQASLANQQAGLQGNQLNLQGQLANQQNQQQRNQLGLQAGMANQQAALSTNQMGLQANLANQQTGLANNQLAYQSQLANQQAGLNTNQMGLQAALANQQNAFQTGAANQSAGLNLAQMGLQAQTSNAGNQLANNQFNASQGNQMGQFNAQQVNAQNQLLAQLGLQAGQFNAGQLNQMGQFNAGQADSAAARYNQLQQFNAGQNQQANLANQQAFAQNYGQQMSGANSLANLFNTQVDQNMAAQQANQNAWLNQRGQTLSGLQGLLGSDNQLAMFNAGQNANNSQFNATLGNNVNQFNAQQNMAGQQFNANQNQLGFANQLAYQQAIAQGNINPLAIAQQAQGQQNWGMFNPWDPAIMAMYAGNAQNAAGAQMSAANNSAATNAGIMNSLGGIAGGIISAYGNKGG